MRIIYAVIACGLVIAFAGVKLLEIPWHKHHARAAVEKHVSSSTLKFRNLKYSDRVCGEYAVSSDPARFHKFYWGAQTGLHLRDEPKLSNPHPERLKGYLEAWDESYTACQRSGK